LISAIIYTFVIIVHNISISKYLFNIYQFCSAKGFIMLLSKSLLIVSKLPFANIQNNCVQKAD